MKAYELMIGDWVKFPIGNEKIVDLLYVEGRGICASFAASATLFPVEVENIEPIPITPEILEKNGFERREDWAESIQDALPFIWENEKTESVVVGWRDSYDNGFRDENAEVWGEYWAINVDGIEARYEKTAKQLYVHELQHALRLCGINKEIIV